MGVTTQLVRFGAFELDVATGELCKNGRRLRLQEQPFRLLNLLLEHPGQPVTRERLKEALWPADTFVDFDHSLNAAVAKVRQALGDSAENPRFVETLARRGYRFIAPVEFVGNGNGDAVQASADDRPAPQRLIEETGRAIRASGLGRRARWLAYATAAVALLGFALWFLHRSQPGETELFKLTDDTGLTISPAVSPDGKLLAYASDRGSTGGLNIWIQQLGSGASSVQLTHGIDAGEPTFSPDGASIAFSSRKDKGGIYLVPVIGGETAHLTPTGRTPRFSPDGRWVAYCMTGGFGVIPATNAFGTIYVVPTSGGLPKRLGLDLLAAGGPVWSPNSKHLLVYVPPRYGFSWDDADWWLLSLDRTSSRRTGDFRALQQQGFSFGFDRMPQLSRWTKDSIVFAAGYGDAFNIWQAPVSSEGHITSSAKRLTSGTSLETSPVITPNGESIFASLNRSFAVWSLPMNTDQAKVTGDPKMITAGVEALMPSISADGRMLAYATARKKTRAGPITFSDDEAADIQVRTKDLSTGKETVLTATDAAQCGHPQISRDGSMVAYTSGKPGQVYVTSVNRESRRIIGGGKGNTYAWDWSLDKRHLLFNSGEERVYSVDLQSGSRKLLLEKPGVELFQAKFSPNDRAIAFIGCLDLDSSGGGQCQIFLAPLQNGKAVPANSWIAIDHPSRWDDKPRWSPEGKLIYFISDRDGYLCLWAQRVVGDATALAGPPFPVYHFHNARLSMAYLDTGALEIDVAKDKIVFGQGELTGNIWSLRRK